MRPSIPVSTALNRAKTALAAFLSCLAWLVGHLVAGLYRLRTGVGAAVRGPLVRAVRGPLATIILGRRATVSVILVGLAPVLAALTAGTVTTTTGYPPLERWLVDTWMGTDPRPVVFAGAAALVALAAVSAGTNAGVLPTTLLVAGPLFGTAITRYGTTVTTRFGERVVSLPDAVAVAAGVAAIGSVAVVAIGYPLGAGCRRAARIVEADTPKSFGRRRTDD